jgi:hypothetical protein
MECRSALVNARQAHDYASLPQRYTCKAIRSDCSQQASNLSVSLILEAARSTANLLLGVTAHPAAEWIARQLNEAFGWEFAPKYLVRDRDRAYGEVFARRVRAMGIHDRPAAS